MTTVISLSAPIASFFCSSFNLINTYRRRHHPSCFMNNNLLFHPSSSFMSGDIPTSIFIPPLHLLICRHPLLSIIIDQPIVPCQPFTTYGLHLCVTNYHLNPPRISAAASAILLCSSYPSLLLLPHLSSLNIPTPPRPPP